MLNLEHQYSIFKKFRELSDAIVLKIKRIEELESILEDKV